MRIMHTVAKPHHFKHFAAQALSEKVIIYFIYEDTETSSSISRAAALFDLA